MSSIPTKKPEDDDNAKATLASKRSTTNLNEQTAPFAGAVAAEAAAVKESVHRIDEDPGKAEIEEATPVATAAIKGNNEANLSFVKVNQTREYWLETRRQTGNKDNGLIEGHNVENPKATDNVQLEEDDDNQCTTERAVNLKPTKIAKSNWGDKNMRKWSDGKHVKEDNSHVQARNGNGTGDGEGDKDDDQEWDEALPPSDLVENDYRMMPGAYRVNPGGSNLGAAVIAGEGGGESGLLVEPENEQEAREQEGAGHRNIDEPQNTGNEDEETFKAEGALVPEQKKHVTAEAQLIPQEHRRKIWLVGLLIITLVIAVVLGVTLGVERTRQQKDSSNNAQEEDQSGGAQNSSSSDQSETLPPTQQPTKLQDISQALIDEFRSSLPNETTLALLNTSSPQYMAMEWMVSSNQHKMNAINPMAQLTQRFALATLYYSTGGSGRNSSKNGENQPWLNTTNWLSYSHHECEWFGCSCSNASPEMVVQSLVLDYNQLVKNLPPEMGLLTDLQRLSLWGNALTGSIPTTVGRLTNLVSLELGENFFAGTIPTQVALLTNLDLFYSVLNLLSGIIPTYIGKLTGLKELDLGQNYLEGTIPLEIGRMTSLTSLSLREQLGTTYKINGTLAAPGLWDNLTDMEALSLDSNELTGSIPSTLGLLTRLWMLHLSDNPLTGSIPTELGKLNKLETVTLFETNLTGSVPKEMCGLIQTVLELEIDCVDINCTCGVCVCNENKTVDDYYY